MDRFFIVFKLKVFCIKLLKCTYVTVKYNVLILGVVVVCYVVTTSGGMFLFLNVYT